MPYNLSTWESNDSKHITHNCLVQDIKLPRARDERYFQQFLYKLQIYFRLRAHITYFYASFYGPGIQHEIPAKNYGNQ